MYEHSPLLKVVMQNADRCADKTALIIKGEKVSYHDLGVNIRKASSVLRSLHIKQGDRIILSAHKEVEYIYLYFGA